MTLGGVPVTLKWSSPAGVTLMALLTAMCDPSLAAIVWAPTFVKVAVRLPTLIGESWVACRLDERLCKAFGRMGTADRQ